MRPTKTLLTVAVAFAALAVAADAEPVLDARIGEANLGEYWYGAKITKDDLVGKVVLFEIYGS